MCPRRAAGRGSGGKCGWCRRGATLRTRRGHRRRPPGRDGIGGAHGTFDHAALPGPDRGAGRAGARVALRHRDQPGGARHRGPARRGAADQRPAEPPARRPGRAQGQHRYARPDDDHGRVARARGVDPAAGLVHRAAAARGGGDHPGQAEHERVGVLPGRARDERLERPGRAVPDALRARPQSVRVKLRLGRGGFREPVRADHRDRDGRVDHVSLLHQRHRRDQTDGRAVEPVGRHSHLALAGHGGADVPHGARCGGAARAVDRRRPPRRGHGGERGEPPRRLHAVPGCRRPAGGAARDRAEFPGVLSGGAGAIRRGG